VIDISGTSGAHMHLMSPNRRSCAVGAGAATKRPTPASERRPVAEGGARQPCLTSISTLLKMLFPLDGSVGVPFSITPVRFFQIVLPAIANGPSLST
jgi:hypothetical protein